MKEKKLYEVTVQPKKEVLDSLRERTTEVFSSLMSKLTITHITITPYHQIRVAFKDFKKRNEISKVIQDNFSFNDIQIRVDEVIARIMTKEQEKEHKKYLEIMKNKI